MTPFFTIAIPGKVSKNHPTRTLMSEPTVRFRKTPKTPFLVGNILLAALGVSLLFFGENPWSLTTVHLVILCLALGGLLTRLSKDSGQRLEMTGIGKWSWSAEISESFQAQIFLNDEIPSDIGSFTVTPAMSSN